MVNVVPVYLFFFGYVPLRTLDFFFQCDIPVCLVFVLSVDASSSFVEKNAQEWCLSLTLI